MSRALTMALMGVVALHGVVHLIGTVAYLKLGEVSGLPYRTTLLAGRWEVGTRGMEALGALYALAALLFLVAAAAWRLDWGEWRALLLGAALLSLVITALDWEKAFVGVLLNAAILAALWLG